MSAAIENVRKDVRMRTETDKMMSTAWLLVYLVPIVSIILMVFSIVLIPMAIVEPAVALAFVPLMGLSWILILV